MLIILLAFYAIHGFPLNSEDFRVKETFAINVHDTYFVISSPYYWLFTLLFTFSTAYLIRILITKFSNRFANYTYLVFNALFIISLVFLIRFFNAALRDMQELYTNVDPLFYYTFYVITAIFIFSVIFEIYVLFKSKKQS